MNQAEGASAVLEGARISESQDLVFPALLGCVDTGSNGIRYVIARFTDLRKYEVVEYERVPVRLGHEVFLTGKLGEATMNEAIGVFTNFRKRFLETKTQQWRAVATSAVREAENGGEFIERVRLESGLEVEVVTGEEEARLAHIAVANRIELGNSPWLLVDLGGGSVEISLVDAEGIRWAESHTMGSVRLLEELTSSGADPGAFLKLLEEYASTLRIPISQSDPPVGYIATGGNIESLAKLANSPQDANGIFHVKMEELRSVIVQLASLSYRQRIEKLGLRADRADVILPAAIIYERLGQLVSASEILVPTVGIKDGILLDLAYQLSPASAVDRWNKRVVDSAIAIGRKYQFDEVHARQVAKLSLEIFDQTGALHGLGKDSRRILNAAALLHEIGSFVSRTGHHKHSLYLIANSGLIGFGKSEIDVVANVARYHRKHPPRADHIEFQRLSKSDQKRTLKLGAILRMADSLDREHASQVNSLVATVDGDTLRLAVQSDGDLLLESWSLKKRSDLFKLAFEMKVSLERLSQESLKPAASENP